MWHVSILSDQNSTLSLNQTGKCCVFAVFKSAQFENSQYNNSDSLIHLLNIANVIPFIASLGIHFIFIHVVIYREKNKTRHRCQQRERKDYMDQQYLRQTYLNL